MHLVLLIKKYVCFGCAFAVYLDELRFSQSDCGYKAHLVIEGGL